MRRLLVATQRVDPAHPALAATIPLLEALAARLDELVVLADTVVPGALDPRVRAHGFGASTRLVRGVRFERALAAELRRGRLPVLAHMVPLYALLAAPLVRPAGAPLLLWYTHWNATRALRLATRASTAVLSVDAASFPLRTRKLRPLGHGVDVARFDRPRPPAGGGLRVVALGRVSPMKRYPTLVRAVALARARGADVSLRVNGPSLTAEERAHRAEVEREIASLGLAEHVRLGGPIPWADVPDALAAADVLANLAEAADKIVFEAAAARTLPVASAASFSGLLPDRLRFPRADARALADRLVALAETPPEERLRLGEELRRRVAASHSVDSWADAVLAAAGLARDS